MINKDKIKSIFSSSFNSINLEKKADKIVIKDLNKQLFSKNKKLKIKTMLFFYALIASFLLAITLIISGIIIHFKANFNFKDDIYHSFLILGTVILSFLAIYLIIVKKLKNDISEEKRDGLFIENNAIKWRWMINFYKIKPAKPKKNKTIKEVKSL